MNDACTWSTAIATAVLVHVAVLVPDGTPRRVPTPPVSVSVTLAPRPIAKVEPATQKPATPEPVAVPQPEAEPEPIAAPPQPSPRARRSPHPPRARDQNRDQSRDPSTNTDLEPSPSAAPRRIDLGSSGSGVVVHGGTGSTDAAIGGAGSGGAADANGSGRDADATTRERGAVAWRPASEIHVRKLPWPRRVPELACESVAQGVHGTVVLGVQVRHDGGIHRVRIIEGIGGGCDEIAARALRRAAFDPAIGTDGRAVDFEVRYEYAFER